MASALRLSPADIVEAVLVPRVVDGIPEAHLIGVGPLEHSRIRNAAALMPGELCPALARESLTLLVAIVEAMRHPALRQCLNAFLAEHHRDILTKPTARIRPIDESGTSLRHCVEVVQVASNLARYMRADPVRIEVTQVAAIIHHFGWDIADTEMIMAAHRNCDRRFLNMGDIVAPEAIADLKRQWPRGGRWLVDILDSVYQFPARRHSTSDAGQLICTADLIVRARVWNQARAANVSRTFAVSGARR